VIAVDVQGNMFVAGTAYGPGFPMLNSFDASFNGTWDAFVFKLNADGDELEFSTYIGGSDSEACRSFALDSEGNLVILGQTQSIDFPTFNAYDDTYQGEGTDCFITKLNALGTDLIFSTYIGGSFFDYPIGMDLDSSDNIYVAGQTSSFDFPLVNALQPEHNGHGDCFVFKMNSTGTNLEFSTYVGGWLDDTAFDIAVNESGDIFVGARTRSPDFPIINAFDRTHNGDYDFVLFQLDPTGTNLMYSTFIGGSSYEWVLEMTADNSGNVYIAGSTDSYDFPTINADDSSPNGGGECVVLKIYPSPTDGDANRFSDFLFFTSLSGTPIIVLLLLFVGRHKIRLLLLSRIPTDPSKRARVAGYLFGVLVLFLPYGFSYRPDYLAQLSWTQREFSISLGLFAIKNNVNGLGFEILNSYLGVFLLVFIPLIAYLLRIA
ncbi:MAG: SBBP repeat-containing protein, partial [Candidatus Thorarchaeota archaeon]